MNRSALSIKKLAEMMRDAAARTFDPTLRYTYETDAVLYGKVVQLDSIAESLYTAGDLTEEAEHLLMTAARELDRAFKHLVAIVFP